MDYNVNEPVLHPVWSNHEVVGVISISRVDADFLNKISKNIYIGYTDVEHELIKKGEYGKLLSEQVLSDRDELLKMIEDMDN